ETPTSSQMRPRHFGPTSRRYHPGFPSRCRSTCGFSRPRSTAAVSHEPSSKPMSTERAGAAPTVCVVALKESAADEQRVAIDPDASGRLVAAGFAVSVEASAGEAAGFTDDRYREVGATVLSRAKTIQAADILAVVRTPDDALIRAMHAG